ncbi:MAG: response regulator [Nitrospira sp.]|nr:response regulator [Nitrospira sp.]
MQLKNDLYRSYHNVNRALALATVGMASLALIGWSLQIQVLTSRDLPVISMNTVAAFGFLCAATSALALSTTRSETGILRQSRRLVSVLPATVAGLMGLGTLVGYAVGMERETPPSVWMSPSAAVSFMLFTLAVVTFVSERRAVQRVSEAAVLLMVWISGIALIGYLYDEQSLYTFGQYASITLPTAISFLLLGGALVCVSPDRGFMGAILSQEAGGLMLRRMVPLTFVMVIVTGWLRIGGQATGWFNHTSGMIVGVGLNIAGFSLVLWMVARALTSADRQRRESEIRLQLAKEAAGIGIHDYDVRQGTIRWDGRVRELWGVGAHEPITAETFWTSVCPDDQAMTKAAMHHAFDPTGDGRYHAEFQVLSRTDGQMRWVEAIGCTIFERGRVVRLVGTVRDISKRKQSETALRESEKKLREFAAQLESLITERTQELVQLQERLRAMANELNLAEQRERKRLATELHDHLQQMLVVGKLTIGKANLHASGMPQCEMALKKVDDILSEALTYSRTLVAELSPPVLHDHGLAAGLTWLAEYMRKYNQTVTVLLSANQDVPLPEAHRIMLFQSVRELLINTSKHANTGTATVRMEQCEDYLYVTVSDEGQGFDVVTAAMRNPTSGISSKFGLFSIQERMRALGGSFDIQSAPGRGTIATLTLPLSGTAAIRTENPTLSPQSFRAPQSSDRKRDKTIRVLLVDDHTMVRQGIRAVLDGYPDLTLVGEAANGEEAVRLVEELHPAVVVMDVNMPKLNGIEATRRITAAHPDVHVIGLSIDAETSNQHAMRAAGAQVLLTKEYAAERLYVAIQTIVAESCTASRPRSTSGKVLA